MTPARAPHPTVAREVAIRRRERAQEELAIRSFAAFVQQAIHQIEPKSDFAWNWHNDIICEELEMVFRREVRELCICIPPGLGKSMIVSALFPAWIWIHRPEEKMGVLSQNERPLKRDAIRMRNLINTTWYKRLAKEAARRRGDRPWGLSSDQNERDNYSNTIGLGTDQARTGGARVFATMKSGLTGDRYDGMIVDDPYDTKEAALGTPEQVKSRMEEGVIIYKEAHSRLHPRRGWRVVIMQRVADGDLAGELIASGVRCVVLPMMFDPTVKNIHLKDPRKNLGDLLFPKNFDADYCNGLKEDPHPKARHKWLAQYQQNPAMLAGVIFRREWLENPDRTYSMDPLKLARTLKEVLISLDCTFDKGKKHDRVAMMVLGRDGPKKYILDLVVDQMSMLETMGALRSLAAKWPMAQVKLVELAANGPAVINLMQREMTGLIGFPVAKYGKKEARAQTTKWAYEAGEVWLPASAPWRNTFIEEHCSFPFGDYDDIIDAESQAFIRWAAEEEGNATEKLKNELGWMGGIRR